MATNKRYNPESIRLPAASTYSSGDPIRSNGVNGVCTEDSGNVMTGYATVNTEGVWTLPVTATDQEGNTTVAVNDVIYISSSGVLSRDSSGHPFGVAQAAVAVGATASIDVFIVQDASDAVGGPGDVGTLCFFNSGPVTSKKTGGAATGTAGDENNMIVDGQNFEYHILGTQTIVAPKIVAGGLDINMDQTDDDGVEITRGITARNPEAFTVGTSPAFYARCEINVEDVSGSDDCAFGFRKLEAYQAAIDNYDEMAALNLISGTVTIETILNGAATTSTSTTDTVADGATVVLEVYVSAAGVVTYKIDGAAPTVTAAFTFDTGEVVIPFLYLLNATDVAGVVSVARWESGLQ